MNVADANHAVYEAHTTAYDGLALHPAERVLLKRLGGRLAGMSMLDVGVGTGRTAYTFAALTRRYLGIDYSQAMIARARERIGEDETTRFAVLDARRMAEELGGERFDLVTFSYNGIDSLEHEDRLTVLAQARRVVAEDGLFFFSSHSLLTLPLRASRPQLSVAHPVRSAYRALTAARRARRLRRSNRDAMAGAQPGFTMVRDDAHDFEGLWYYVRPSFQVTQLADAGFAVLEVLDPEGRTADPEAPGGAPWLHYLCAPR